MQVLHGLLPFQATEYERNMTKGVFSSLDWKQVQPGLTLDKSGGMGGHLMVSDALGRATACDVELQVGCMTGGREWLAGDICPDVAEGSYAQVEFLLRKESDAQTAFLSVALRESAPGYKDAAVALAAGASLMYGVVVGLAKRLGSEWLVQVEILVGQSDRVHSVLQDELHRAACLVSDAGEGYAMCLPSLKFAA